MYQSLRHKKEFCKQIFTFSLKHAIFVEMKRGKKRKKAPEVVTITNRSKSRPKLDRFIAMRTCVMLVLSVMMVVLSINTASNLITSHAVSVSATGTWENKAQYSESLQVRSGGKVSLPIPEKFEHTFAGWYRDAALTRPFNPQTNRIKRNTTLHARFTRNLYTITLIDPSLYLKSDGTLNENPPETAIQTFTRTVGTHFIFPDAPRTPDKSENLGKFMGWSLSMHYQQPDHNERENTIANPGTRFPNFFRQNVTYWAAWSDWTFPNIDPISTESVRVVFEKDTTVGKLNDEHTLGSVFKEYPVIPPQSLPRADLQLTLPSMFFGEFSQFPLINDNYIDTGYYTVLNNGLTAYSFGGWALTPNPTPGQRIFRDGEVVRPDTLEITNERITFYAVWLEHKV